MPQREILLQTPAGRGEPRHIKNKFGRHGPCAPLPDLPPDPCLCRTRRENAEACAKGKESPDAASSQQPSRPVGRGPSRRCSLRRVGGSRSGGARGRHRGRKRRTRCSRRVAGRMEPLIRWEGHYFDRLCKDAVRARAREAGLASPRPAPSSIRRSRQARWAMVRRAAGLDHDAAYQSVSWGVGQVMGAHWQALGYAGVDELVAEARSGLGGQFRLMLRFLRHAGLAGRLAAARLARASRAATTGAGYRRNGYDAKLRLGLCGLQRKRRRRGGACGAGRPATTWRDCSACWRPPAGKSPWTVVSGPETEAAVRDFQRANGWG